MNEKSIRLTSAEIASLWASFMNDSMAKCILGFMIKYIQDTEIRPVVQYAYELASSHLEYLHDLLEREEFSVPYGFSEKDVNMKAPWLFSDIFCLTYVNHMARTGLVAYSGSLAMSSRSDISSYYTKGLAETTKLFNLSNQTALSKGMLARHPCIEVPKEAKYIDGKDYLSGLNPFTTKRPLNAIELSHLYMNVMTNSIGIQLTLSFAQTSTLKEVQEYMLRGNDISNKHIEIFTKILLDNNIPTPRLPDVSVSNSVTRTFSDKLMMFHMSLLSAAGTGNYATAAAASQRSDLAINYERLSLEIAQYAKSGAEIMLKHHWLEQPPGTKDRRKLALDKDG
ncbi:hypothetical protein AB685_15345 [Bacillus sp. LL01]|uniref:DUF3231 family protein n=1 Tax=Bacillus sp. LL01 TaxID=1665556 RepID=UPI00064D52ED|nr:DUF3231 family protein [Bacillus sp. LL01]KMJ57403.1 hypothetical protein AB685_15345 [Bacillus sp. LL01]